ncbi:MAG: hypothetical protein AB1921_02335 [Thermodesulfobacteriota bacterium]
MNTAYINVIERPDRLSGVFQRIANQLSASRQLGLPIDFHLFCYENPSRVPEGLFVHLLPPPRNRAFKVWAQYLAVKKVADGYDAVILRELPRTPLYASIFEKRNFALITEHHTRLLSEILASGRGLSFLVQRVSTGMCLAQSDGMICVTGEICQDQKAHGYKGPTRVISNGIAVGKVSRTGFTPFDGSVLDLVFVASAPQPWHGLERLARGLDRYHGETAVKVDVVGDIPESALQTDNPRVLVRFNGPLTGQDLDLVMARANIAISSLAPYRKRMREACSLKTRDYMARGIPFIYAYDDPDVPADFPYALKLGNDPSPVSLDAMILFAREMALKAKEEDISRAMRSHAEEHMDFGPKMEAYLAFARETVDARQE